MGRTRPPAGGGTALDPFTRAIELLELGETFVLATALTPPDPDRPARPKVIVRRDGTREGTTGSPHLDAEVTARALRLLQERRSRVEEVLGHRVFFDVLSGEAHLVICGAGHIALPLARFCREVGFGVTVVDDRPDFASAERFPACQVVAEDFVAALGRLPLGPNAYAVVITRGHEHDLECLAEILRRETAYTGLIGSRRRVGFVLETLAQQGIPRERLERVFTPIGLPVGGESPGEIALSIAAELVCVRRRGAEHARALRAAGGKP